MCRRKTLLSAFFTLLAPSIKVTVIDVANVMTSSQTN